jgi:thioredoxin-like negative regulator of GroEL
MEPTVSGLRQEYGDRIDFVRFDIDDPTTQDAKEQYGYRYQPHYFLVNRSGQIVDSWLGRVPEETLVEAFENVLSE